jgi:DNA-binding LacI/PurR family transcriptional regulator/signal transduction histidine kinase/CheY-like chemotaxis protein
LRDEARLLPSWVVRRTIAVLVDHIDHVNRAYESQLRAGFVAACASSDLNLLVVSGRELGEAPHDRIYRHLKRGSVDGVIVVSQGLGALVGTAGLLELIQGFEGLPVVSLGLALPGVPSVVCDNRPGFEAALEHLILDHGRRRIAFLGGPETHLDARVRKSTFLEVSERHGLDLDPSLIRDGAFGVTAGVSGMQSLLAAAGAPDAVVAINDVVALGALQALRARGLRVPRDVSILGFDDLALARYANPPFSTVRQPLERMAATAIDTLLLLMGGHEGPELTDLPAEFVQRVSCGCDAVLTRRTSTERALRTKNPLSWLEENASRLVERLAGEIRTPRPRAVASMCVLLHGLRCELEGDRGSLLASIEDVAGAAASRNEIYDELQAVISILRDELGGNPELEDAWHQARSSLAAANAAEHARRRMAIETSYWRVLSSGERLSTAFDWPSLKAALTSELPELVESAFISLYTDAEGRELRPFFCLRDGQVFEPEVARFPASLLVPPGALGEHRRRTWFVLPLTCESDNLGVAVFDAGDGGIGAHEMLRKQIGAALKSVALHREIVQKTMLHERSVQERIATAKRMNSLSLLAGGIAHDLNNALGPLVALPDVILLELDEANADLDLDELRTDVSTIKDAALRASQTIKDLLVLGRQGRTRREAVDLSRLVRSCVTAEARANDVSRVRFELVEWAEPLVVVAAESQLARAITNLLRNALEAMGGQGEVRIETRAVELERAYTAYEQIDAGNYAVVTVKDRGRGIDPADLGRIFEPFFTKKRASESSGSGLGLSIVHGVLKEHDGFVDVVSTPGQGTEFSLYFRRSQEKTQQPQARPTAAPRSAEILVVDDDPVQLRTGKRVLSRLGYEVQTSRSGVQARALCEARGTRTPFDLLIVDMLLNERDDGLSVFERVERFVPGQRGIIVSGHAPTERVRRAIQKGLFWLAKPYSSDDLGRAVETALIAPGPELSRRTEPPLSSAGSLAIARRPSEPP